MKGMKNRVYMVGPSLGTQGGISSVLAIYRKNFGEQLDLRFLSSYSGKNRMLDFLYFTQAIIQVCWINLLSEDPIFHIHMASTGSYLRKSILAKICYRFRHKVILHIHGAMFDQFMENASPEKKKDILQVLGRADRVVALSESWRAFFAKTLPPDKLEVIYNPSSTYRDGFVKTARRSGIRLLFMGRIGDRKGAYDLIRAVGRVKDVHFTLEMYGDGELEKARELVRKENLQGRVTVNNWVPHSKVRELYEKADIIVLPSYAEGLPMSLLEAIGVGLPVLSTRVGGIPELVEDGRNGFLTEPGDVDALADRIRTLVTSPEKIESMGRESLNIARDRFSTQTIGHQLQELYQTLWGKAGDVG